MKITKYNNSLIVVPSYAHMKFKPMYMSHVARRYEDSDCDDGTMRWINFNTVCIMAGLGPLVVIPGRIIFSVWNLAMTVFTGIASLATLGRIPSLNRCCWKAMIDAFSEVYALAVFLVAMPILTILSFFGAVVHPAIAAPGWWMMHELSVPLKELRNNI
jgi:hypothetical protein